MYNGLFDYCFKKIGNPFKNKIFEITGNPEDGYEDVLYEICDNTNDSDYKSKNSRDSYLQIDFKNRSFCFFAIQICDHSANGNTIKNFSLEGSNNGSTWALIYEWRDVLTKPNLFCRCWINNNPKDDYYRFLRIKLNGPNTSGNYHLCLRGSVAIFR